MGLWQTVIGENFPQTLEAARTGAEWAWTSIYRDLAPAVLGYLRGRGVDDAEDLTGEVFLQVVRDLRSFEGGEREFRSWVFVIAHNRLLDERRRRARRPVEPMPEVPTAEGRSRDTEEEALQEVASDRVRRIIAKLSESRVALPLQMQKLGPPRPQPHNPPTKSDALVGASELSSKLPIGQITS